MNRLVLGLSVVFYFPVCFASQTYIDFGNFSEPDIPDNSAMVIPEGSNNTVRLNSDGRVALIEDERNGVQTLDLLEVRVTGKVKKLTDPSIRLTQSSVGQLENAAGIEVRFWQPARPAQVITTETDEQGNYEVKLRNGNWQGEACGSDSGYYPAAWQVQLVNNSLVSLQQTPQRTLSINNTALETGFLAGNFSNGLGSTHVYETGDMVTLNGVGFGCSGSLVLVYQNSLDIYGEPRDVRYDNAPLIIGVADMLSRSETQIKFSMPNLSAATLESSGNTSRRIAKIYYQKAGQRSNAIYISQFVSDIMIDNRSYAEDVVETTPGIDRIDVRSEVNIATLATAVIRTDVVNTGNNDFVLSGLNASLDRTVGNQRAAGQSTMTAVSVISPEQVATEKISTVTNLSGTATRQLNRRIRLNGF